MGLRRVLVMLAVLSIAILGAVSASADTATDEGEAAATGDSPEGAPPRIGDDGQFGVQSHAVGATHRTIDDDGYEVFRVEDGHDLDKYLFRDSSPLQAIVELAGGDERPGPFDEEGYPLPDSPLYDATARLTLRAWDVDEEQGEVDQVVVNGNEVPNGLLSGANNQWSINTFEVPARWLRIQRDIPLETGNLIEVLIDLENGSWAVEIDWIEIRLERDTAPLMMNHGITGGVDANGDGCADTSEGPAGVVKSLLDTIHEDAVTTDGPWLTCPVATLNRSAETNATALQPVLDDMLDESGHLQLNIMAHSMGGLNSRVLAHRNSDKISSIHMLGTPNGGSGLATTLCNARAAGIDWVTPDMGPCDSAADGLYQLRTSYMENVFNPTYPDLPQVRYRVYAGKQSWFHSGDGTVSLSSAYRLRRAGETAGDLDPQPAGEGGRHEVGEIVTDGHSELWTSGSSALPFAMCSLFPDDCDAPGEPLFWGRPPSQPSDSSAGGASVQSTPLLDEPDTVEDGTVMLLEPHSVPAGDSVSVPIDAEDASWMLLQVLTNEKQLTAEFDGESLELHDVFGAALLETFADPATSGDLTVTNPSADAVEFLIVATGDTGRTLELESAYGVVGETLPLTMTSTGFDAGELVDVVTHAPDGSSETVTVALDADGTAEVPFSADHVGSSMLIATSDSAPTRFADANVQVLDGEVTLHEGIAATRVDADSDGLYDRAEVTIDVTSPDAGPVRAVAVLRDSEGATVTAGVGEADLDAGVTGSVTLGFDGAAIHAAGHDGPYTLSDVVLVDAASEQTLARAASLGSTPSWLASSFQHDRVVIGRSFTDHAVDDDGNGQFDRLLVSGEVTVTDPGTYAVNARLVAPDGTELTRYEATRSLQAGTQGLEMTFLGLDIGEAGLDGPYLVQDLSVYPLFGSGALGYRVDVHTTAAYLASEFEGGGGGETSYQQVLNEITAAEDAGELHHGQANALRVKVERARQAESAGNIDAARNALGAAINHAEQINANHITEARRQSILGLLHQRLSELE